MKRIFLCLSFIFICASFATAIAQAEPVFNRNEIIAVAGDALKPMLGKRPENLALFASTGSGFAPVPFQIDERISEKGELKYVYTGGKKAEPDPDADFDGDDELVFWSADAGAKTDRADWPSGAENGVEIAVKDPIGGAVAYVYLLSFSSAAPKSDKRYVTYDPKNDAVQSLYYKLNYPNDDKIGFSSLSVTSAAGGSDENFVDEAKYRVDVLIAGTLIPYQLNKKDIHSKVIAWIDGPVRVRRLIKNYIVLWMWLGSTSCAESVYTPAGFYIDIPVVGFAPVKGLSNLSTRWALELNGKAKGMTFRSDTNPQGAIIDGNYSDAEKKMNYSPPSWLLLSGAPGSILRRPGKLSGRTLYLDLYYMDNEALQDPPEVGAGQIGASGYYIPYAGRRGMKIRENIVEYYDVLPNYKSGDEGLVLERDAKPMQIVVLEADAINASEGPKKWPELKKARKDEPQPTYNYIGAESKDIDSQIIPVIVMSSDNGLGGGLMYVDSNPFDSGIRLNTQFWYTVKSYGVAELSLGEDVPQKGSDWAWIAAARYRIRPGRDFYGVGNDSLREEQTNFFDEMSQLKLWGKRRVFDHVWLGAWIEGRREFIGNGEGDWSPDTFAKDEFYDIYAKGSFWTNRIGAFVLHDTRDNYYIPTKGGYRMIEYYSLPNWMGDDFSFEYWYLDVRQFIPLRQPRKDILALRLQAMHAEGGPIPFHEMAIAGSEYTLRGYFEGRWRDRDMATLNTELRHNLWKIFDVHIYYDIGRVYGDMFQEGEHLLTDMHDAYGWGFRITVPPNIVMRGDFGYSSTDSAFYFNYGQTF